MLDVFYHECGSNQYDRLDSPMCDRAKFGRVRTLADGTRIADVNSDTCVVWLAASRLPL